MNEGAIRQVLVSKAAEKIGRLGTALYWRGMIAIAFGVTAFLWPDASLKVLVYLMGGYFLVDGLASLLSAFRSDSAGDYLLQIITSIVAGVVILAWPDATGQLLLTVLGIWALLMGTGLLRAGRDMKKSGEGGDLLNTSGIVFIVIGVVVFFWQSLASTAIAWTIGTAAIIIGALLVFLGSRLRSTKN
jgi:uncharacterized membrane protein HdeD (DUF308 family)